MKLVKSSVEILEQKPKKIAIPSDMVYGPKMLQEAKVNAVYRQIALVGKRDYNPDFGHGTVYLQFELWHDAQTEDYEELCKVRNKYVLNKDSVVNTVIDESDNVDTIYITTNLRVLVENNWLDDLKYICDCTEHHEKRITVRFTCSREVATKFVCDCNCNFKNSSSVYCDYSAYECDDEVAFILPNWSNAVDGDYGTLLKPLDIQFKEYDNEFDKEFINELINAEFRYMNILKAGYTKQQARTVLPNVLKTELVMTCFVDDWRQFIADNCFNANPEARQMSTSLCEEFLERGYIIK